MDCEIRDLCLNDSPSFNELIFVDGGALLFQPVNFVAVAGQCYVDILRYRDAACVDSTLSKRCRHFQVNEYDSAVQEMLMKGLQDLLNFFVLARGRNCPLALLWLHSDGGGSLR